MTSRKHASHFGLHFNIDRSSPFLAFFGHSGSTHNIRANPMRSAFPSLRIDSALAGVDILPAAMTGTLTSLYTALAKLVI